MLGAIAGQITVENLTAARIAKIDGRAEERARAGLTSWDPGDSHLWSGRNSSHDIKDILEDEEVIPGCSIAVSTLFFRKVESNGRLPA